MGLLQQEFFFDRRDHELIRMVNNVYDKNHSPGYTRKLFYPYFHPFGIKELAESKGLRIAYSVVHLLESMERGDENNRLQALRGLRDEILNTTEGSIPINTARVLLQIMKEIVRAHGSYDQQLILAHDFRRTASGKPRRVRYQLRKYHLLEMPEQWNQVTFDDHVHDANTKGRKSPAHIIMDAWIKGIRRLRVVYYHYIEAGFAAELIESAEIMGIDLRIGIELSSIFRGRFAQFIWVSRGLFDVQSFLCFLAEPKVAEFMEEGRRVLQYRMKYVMDILHEFNRRHLPEIINSSWGISLSPIDPVEFMCFVGPGQASILHLGEFIHTKIVAAMRTRMGDLQKRFLHEDAEGRAGVEALVAEMDSLDCDEIVERFLAPDKNPGFADPSIPSYGDDVPGRLKLSLGELIERVSRLNTGFRITLNLSNLKAEDVLELLYQGGGLITRLEIFNLKDFASGRTEHLSAINDLQKAINEGSFLGLKRVVRQIIERVDTCEYEDAPDRREKLVNILHDIQSFRDMYGGVPLRSRIGSDSTGRSPRMYGMGLGIIHTLPARAQREALVSSSSARVIIPVSIDAYLRTTEVPITSTNKFHAGFLRYLRRLPGLSHAGTEKKRDWIVQEYSTRMESRGNIVTLGGIEDKHSNGLTLESHQEANRSLLSKWEDLNSGVKNGLKVFIGFVPAFATFALTKDWWLLAYFGAFIWFGITGLRNILQSVLGGGGIRRSPLLRWNDYVSWERMTDSLLYTGFSVPLLDYLVKTLFLDRIAGINTSTNPMALYAVMGVANGIYLSTHNAFRGLPRGAIFGNFFRSILSIPVAIFFNAAIGGLLAAGGIVGIDMILQKWAAVISKAASDLMAGIIEGTADRFHNIALRTRDYKTKFTELFDIYSRLELLFPDSGELALLEKPEKLINNQNEEVRDLVIAMIIDSLDMLYFWMYQPRARITMAELAGKLNPEEKKILFLSQRILRLEREISRLFVDGMLGRKFSKPLSFYLMRYEEYLEALKKLEPVISRDLNVA